MSRMLTLIHSGWQAARTLADRGQQALALAQINRLLSRPDLPSALAADARRLAAELLIDSEDFVGARAHLRAARSIDPGCARTHYLAGLAHERDMLGDDRKAALHYRKAVQFAPNNRQYRAAFGRAAVRAGYAKLGVRSLLKAASAAPDDTDVIPMVVEGLIEAHQVRAARRVLAKARFLRPASQVLRKLWDRLRYETARVEQLSTQNVQDAAIATEGDCSVLPFVRLVRIESASTGHAVIRRDLVSQQRPHFPRFRRTRADL